MSMMTEAAPDEWLRDRLIEWEERRERGEEVSAEVLCEGRPDLIEALEERIRELKDWDRLSPRPAVRRGEESSAGDDGRAGAEFLARLSGLAVHSRGGLGVVYKAWHDELLRFVAVKFLQRHHADNPFLRSRFLREAQITAQLEHPGIVPIYGIGHDDAGIPCYVMRFIEGPTLEESIRAFHARDWPGPGERNKAFRELLGHFLAASAAVAHAHGQGVLHRDLKPSNVVVGPLDQAVVLDWGLGKSPSTREAQAGHAEVAEGPDAGPSVPATQGRMGTLGYMSPEQQAGEWHRVDARSDVFSLGVMLYYLLTGKLPFAGGSAAEVFEKVENGTYRAPRQREPRIPRALEAICLRAMSPRLQDRYPTALELVEDLKDWLADEPVSAVPERRYHRWARAVRRHRAAAGAIFVGLLAVAVVATAAAVWIGRARAGERRARERSESRLGLAMQAIGHFRRVVDENVDVQNQPDLKSLRLKLLEGPLEFYRTLREDLQRGEAADPATQARLVRATLDLAMITVQIGPTHQAIEDFEEAIANLQAMTDQDPGDRDGRLLLARGHGELAMLRRAEGHDDLARSHLERTRQLLEGLAARNPGAPVYRVELTRTLDKLALFDLTTRPERAREALERAIGIDRGLLEKAPSEAIAIRVDLARMHNHLGLLHKAAGRPERAEACFQEAIAILEALAAESSEETLYRTNLASAHYNLGNMRCQTGHPGALASLERAREIQEVSLRQRPANSSYRSDLARTVGTIAVLRRFGHRLDEARAGFERARDLLEELARDDPTVPRHRRDLLTTYDNLKLLWREANRPEDAVACLQRMRALLEGLVRESPADQGLSGQLAAVSRDIAKAGRGPGRGRQAPDVLPDDVFAR